MISHFLFQHENEERYGIWAFWDKIARTKPVTKNIVLTIPHKMSEIFLCFSIVSLHHKWDGARLLSLEIECVSCLSSCQAI